MSPAHEITGTVLSGAGLPTEAFATVDTEPVATRNLPISPASPAHVRTAGWRLEDLWLPAVTLSAEAVSHNLDRFRRWCDDMGVELAPHGKTTMSPHLWSAQIHRGVWGLTAATVAQARVMRSHGVSRVLIANEVVEPGQIAWLGDALAEPDFEPLCLVDSIEGVGLLQRHLGAPRHPLPVLIELGVDGGRTGVREITDVVELAERVAATPSLRLMGIEGYEGALPQSRDGSAPDDARQWLDRLTEAARQADTAGAFEGNDEILLTAGGSAFPDLAAEALTAMPSLSRPVRRIVRSGCYVTHDDLNYERNSPLRSDVTDDPLRPALSCFARVLSCPEPGRAILGVGKRDVAFDIDLPVVRAVHRDGARFEPSREVAISKLNDHHGFCTLDGDVLAVGDTVELGLSHPCTVFDKWPLIPVLDKDNRVVDAIRTIF